MRRKRYKIKKIRLKYDTVRNSEFGKEASERDNVLSNAESQDYTKV